PPRADRTAEVIAVHSARAKFLLRPGASPWLDVTSLQLSYPYVMVERTDEGVFPYSVLTVARATRQDASDDSRSSIGVRLRRVEVDEGKVEFLDHTFTPVYWTALTSLHGRGEGLLFPQLTVDHFDLNGRQDSISPAQLSGSVTARGLEARGRVDDLLLES